MPKLGLGLGLTRSKVKPNPLRDFLKYADWAILPDMASGSKLPKLAPRTLPNGVENTDYVQYVSDDYVLQATDVVSVLTRGDRCDVLTDTIGRLGLLNIVTFIDSYQGVVLINGKTEIAFSAYGYTPNGFMTVNNQRLYFQVPLGTTLEQAREILAGTVIRYQLATPINTLNDPLTNPMVDLVGEVGKNLFDPVGTSQEIFYSVLGKQCLKATNYNDQYSIIFSENFKPLTAYTIKSSFYQPTNITARLRFRYSDGSTVIGVSETDVGEFAPIVATSDPTKNLVSVILNSSSVGEIYYDINETMLNEGTEALPYEPYGKANVLWQGMAGTASDGYIQETVNGKERTFAKLDGIDTYGRLVAENAPNPTGQQDFAQLIVFKSDEIGLDAYYGVTRNGADGSDMQYGFFTNGSGGYTYRLSGISVRLVGGVTKNITWALYGKINDKKFLIVDGVALDEVTFTDSFVASNNVQLGSRSDSIDGLIKATFSKGNQGLCAMWYKGDTPLDKDKIVEDSKKIVNYLYGL